MSLQSTTNTVTVSFEGKEYTVSYTNKSTAADSRHFLVAIHDEMLKQISGEAVEYTLISRDNLEELNYPPTDGERDLLLKKTIIREIFKKEGIRTIV